MAKVTNQSTAVKKSEKESQSLKKYFRGVRSEFKKVVWPSKKELISYSGLVILVSAIVAIAISILDLIIHTGLSFFLG